MIKSVGSTTTEVQDPTDLNATIAVAAIRNFAQKFRSRHFARRAETAGQKTDPAAGGLSAQRRRLTPGLPRRQNSALRAAAAAGRGVRPATEMGRRPSLRRPATVAATAAMTAAAAAAGGNTRRSAREAEGDDRYS